MTQPYISGDIRDQIQTARSLWVPWEVISNKLGLSVDQCREAIGLPSLKPIPEVTNEPDLFSGLERLEQQL
jgi:hypothetical protein